MKRADWDTAAPNWIAWVRELADDAYHDYAPSFFDDVVPMPGRATLDVGCGEGRSARELRAAGHRVVGIDGSPAMTRAARDHDATGSYLVADAAALPFADGSFDLAVAYNVLMDLDDLEGSLQEIARVLELGGRLAACVLHPVAEAGSFEERAAGARFAIEDSYFGVRDYKLTFERRGRSMTFSSTRYPLESYARALEGAGFAIERLREPRAPASAVEADPSEERWTRVPLFLFLGAIKIRSASG